MTLLSSAAILFSSAFECQQFYHCSKFRILLPILSLMWIAEITSALKKLNWLLMHHCVTFRSAILVHSGSIPNTYLCDLIHFNTDSSRKRLKSTATIAATTVQTCTGLGGDHAFFVAAPLIPVDAPVVWNGLPPSLQLVDVHTQFCRHLKTYLLTVNFFDKVCAAGWCCKF